MWKNEKVFTVNCKKANYQMPKSNVKTYPKMDISTIPLSCLVRDYGWFFTGWEKHGFLKHVFSNNEIIFFCNNWGVTPEQHLEKRLFSLILVYG